MSTSSSSRGLTGLLAMTVGAIGVVYGDIGTSPLYAVNEIFSAHTGFEATHVHALQAVSLIFWALVLLVTIEYIVFVLQADHEGEGGVFALLALLGGRKARKYKFLIGALLLSAGFLYGDGIITPAISVLSAVEGLNVATTTLAPYVLPVTILILTALFSFQYKGTAKVGAIFGPVMLVWFVCIAVLGFRQIVSSPQIFLALNPLYAINFLFEVPVHTLFAVLGSVMLSVTGGEALYADLGHFGKQPIRLGWLFFTFPCLLLNYFGQGAYVMSDQQIVNGNIFYSMVPHNLIYPMVILAMLATIIASQALITGVFSLTSQATQLNLLPKFTTVHTHPDHRGQIYQPTLNWGLYVGCVMLVLIFKSSNNLAAAYGLAVSALMCVTAFSMRYVAADLWHWNKIASNALFGFFTVFCLMFFIANSVKFLAGGYLPVSIGVVIFIAMTTWDWGKGHIRAAADEYVTKTLSWIKQLRDDPAVPDLPRALVFLTSRPLHEMTQRSPSIFFFFFQKYGALPEHLLFFHAETTHDAYVEEKNRYSLFQIADRVMAVTSRVGFMEKMDVRKTLTALHAQGKITVPPDRWIIEVRENQTVLRQKAPWWFRLRLVIYGLLDRFSAPEHNFFELGHDAGISMQSLPIEFAPEYVRFQFPEWEVNHRKV